MARQRSDAEQQVADLLRTAKESLQISVAFLTRMDGTTQHLEVVESSVPFLFKEGATQKQQTTFCQAILDGKLPAVLPDVKQFPVAMSLPAARIPRIRSYVSVPVVLSDGTLYGTFCAAGLTSDKGLTKRDKSLMDVLAHAAAVIIEPGIRSRERAEEIEQRIWPVMEAGGPVVVLQPIVDLATGVRVGAEALSRFPLEWAKAPDLVFGEAHSVGLGHELELLALAGAAEHVASVSGYVAMNISPSTLMTPCRHRVHQPAAARPHPARALRARPGRGLRRAARRACPAARSRDAARHRRRRRRLLLAAPHRADPPGRAEDRPHPRRRGQHTTRS